MSLQISINNRLNILYRNFLCTISDHYNIDYAELCAFVDTANFAQDKNITCLHIMISGKNKGKHCPSKALGNGYCRKHQATVGAADFWRSDGVLNTKIVKTKEMTKTQLQIIDWLNTAVPNEETVLKRRSKGLLNEETDILFDDDHIVIGKLDNNKIEKLSAFEIEICEKHGWQYKDGIIESDED